MAGVVVEVTVVDGWLEARPKLKPLLAAVLGEVDVAAVVEVPKDNPVDVFEGVPRPNPVLDATVVVGANELNGEAVGALVVVVFGFKPKSGVDWELVMLAALEKPDADCDVAVVLVVEAVGIPKENPDCA